MFGNEEGERANGNGTDHHKSEGGVPGSCQPLDVTALLESLQADAEEVGAHVSIEGSVVKLDLCTSPTPLSTSPPCKLLRRTPVRSSRY